jgi:DNA-directed RNA polymerase subunit M/transcription elongation factor TFIIS
MEDAQRFLDIEGKDLEKKEDPTDREDCELCGNQSFRVYTRSDVSTEEPYHILYCTNCNHQQRPVGED